MHQSPSPTRRQKRKQARPSEIVEAALQVFIDKGYAATNLNDVAKSAGVAKGTLYLYFETKQDLFRAVVQAATATNIEALRGAAAAFDGHIRELIPQLLLQASQRLSADSIPAVARLVIGESQQFPDLARIWHDQVANVVIDLMSGLLKTAQANGEIRAGNPRLQAISVLGPLAAFVLLREVFGEERWSAADLRGLALEHAATVLDGLSLGQAAREG